MVAGTGRFCTEVMGRFGERAYVKTGAEGVFCAILPERGLGVALKIDDGGTRASEALMAAVLQRFVARDEEERGFLDAWAKRPIRTRREKQAGEVRVAAETLAGLGVSNSPAKRGPAPWRVARSAGARVGAAPLLAGPAR